MRISTSRYKAEKLHFLYSIHIRSCIILFALYKKLTIYIHKIWNIIEMQATCKNIIRPPECNLENCKCKKIVYLIPYEWKVTNLSEWINRHSIFSSRNFTPQSLGCVLELFFVIYPRTFAVCVCVDAATCLLTHTLYRACINSCRNSGHKLTRWPTSKFYGRDAFVPLSSMLATSSLLPSIFIRTSSCIASWIQSTRSYRIFDRFHAKSLFYTFLCIRFA